MDNKGFPTKKEVEQIRKEYPKGTIIILDEMNDPYRQMPKGLYGTVRHVDDSGTIHASWSNGGSLGIIYGVDSCHKVQERTEVVTICYGESTEWESRQAAADFFLRAIAGSDGSEMERYAKIHAQLLEGRKVCTDGEV